MGAKVIHKDMVKKVTRAPINTYFDVTPAGRILNKFSKDLQVADVDLSWNVSSFYPCAAFASSTFIISMVTVPLVISILPIVVFAAYKISFQNIPVFKEMNRIESVTKSPLLQLM
jgi:ATP-binding cassette subfamily C (CFTR/MRP) protein 1